MPRKSSSSPSRKNRRGPYSSALELKPSYIYSSPKSPISPLPTTVLPLSRTTPPPIHSPPQVLNNSVQVQQPGFFSNMWQGFGLGAGQSIASNMFRSDPVVKHVHDKEPTIIQTATADTTLSKEYIQCMKESQNNIDSCKQYLTQEESNIK
jgi:hypothetical protein